ncbi:uncharacterized protein LOC106639848 [Copidosoma floridanum]|uniref:uncharacterized protein LOC106639848 n=1 Tax=Copidosoma floridanum TaxID=29053 RepID=UPI0006C99F9E|nr:uncharacterized protein LOC106639848 [Copidosoma floridanum]
MENQDHSYIQDNEPIVDSSAACLNKSQQQLSCWLYISRSCGLDQQQHQGNPRDGLPRANLEDAILAVEPQGPWHVSETHCGLLAGFGREADADKLLQYADLASIFEGPVQVARFYDRDTRYRQALLLRDVPWAIQLQDLSSALARQGIATGSVERLRHYIRVEVLDPSQYELLLRQGLDFFGVARFCAVPERWWRGGPQSPFSPDAPPNQQPQQQQQPNQQSNAQDDVLQCFRCQGFWHVAANCRHLPRCVRCGEPHSVEFCPRPRNNPVCCHCAGPHHAAYRQCPVRLQLLNATPVSLTLSASRLGTSSSYGKSSGASSVAPAAFSGHRSSHSS